jgi:hypothetical protein
MMEIILGHPSGRKPPLEGCADALSVEFADTLDGGNGFILVVDDKAGNAFIDNLRHRAAPEGDDWSSAGHSLDHYKPEGLRPINRKEECRRASEEVLLAGIIEFADKLALGKGVR